MQYINDISINEAVIHILDNNSSEVVYNEDGIMLNDETYEYILKHVKKCLNDEWLRYAAFEDKADVGNSVQAYLSGKSRFIPLSKYISSKLFQIMKSKGSIPSCDLLVVSLATEYGPMLGILKMDYVKNFKHRIDTIENKVVINITSQDLCLPGSTQKIEKAAFIKLKQEENQFDLMILDKQPSTKDDDNYGSKYFIKEFLSCGILENDRDATRAFVTAAEKWTQRNLKDNADAAEKIRTSIKQKLKQDDEINIENLSNEIFDKNVEVKENFIQFLKDNGINEKVEVDKKYIDKKLSKTRLKIDKDIELLINENAYSDLNRFQVKRNGNGTIDLVIKQIRNYIEK